MAVLPNNPKKCVLFLGLLAEKVSRYSRQSGEGVPYLRQEQELSEAIQRA